MIEPGQVYRRPGDATVAAEKREKEAGQPTPWDVAFREGARSRDRELGKLRDELAKALTEAEAAADRVRAACARLKANAVNVDGEPYTSSDERLLRVIERILAALDPQED